MGWSKEEVDNLKHHSGFANIFKPASWGKRFHVYRYSKNEGDWNGKHRILPICWSPYSTKPNPGDKILAIVDGFGEYGIPDDVSVAAALASGIPKDTGRVVVFIRTINSVQTNSHVLGASVGGAIAPNSDNKGLSAILGANFGGTNVQIKDKPEIKILCLNAGPLDPPQMPEPARPAVQQAQVQVPPPPPPPQVVKVEVDVRVEPIQIAPLPVPQALTPQPLPPAPAPQAKTCSGLPDLTVLFALDKSEVGSDYLPKIKEFATWLGNHPSCRVQVEGHTCTIGSAAYNAALGLRRAKAAYDKLIDAGGKPDQIEQKVSLGKDKPASENRPENRRTILRIVGPASGK
jgi:outer membrane protein OmpA-like peptidoglycan-associated protein